MRYSLKFREKMIEKMAGANGKRASELSAEVGVHQATLSRWLREAKMSPMAKEKKRSGRTGSGGRRSAEGKVRLVMEAAALSESELGGFLRREGLHEADLVALREEVDKAAIEGLRPKKKHRGLSPEQKKIRRLEKELNRKEKALAEAAALLVLRGKVQAFLAMDGEEGNTDGSYE